MAVDLHILLPTEQDVHEFIANGDSSEYSPEEKLLHLNLFLEHCVKEEYYEYAAIIRDHIKSNYHGNFQ